MKLIRIKITDPKGFRSLQSGFEHHFRKDWQLKEEKALSEFAPFVCAGPNGSGKSNILEAIAAIFYHMECMYLNNKPESFVYDEDENPKGYRGDVANIDGFEIEYLIKPKEAMTVKWHGELAHILIRKEPQKSPKWFLLNHKKQSGEVEITISGEPAKGVLPDYVLGYSSGENEILSLPFFKMRFVQYDEYWRALHEQLYYPGTPESRLSYLDQSFSQAILLSNLLFQSEDTLTSFREEVGIESLNEFRIIVKRHITVPLKIANEFGISNPCVRYDNENDSYQINLVSKLEVNENLQDEIEEEKESEQDIPISIGDYEKLSPSLTRLKRCATSWFEDESTDSLYLDYCVNQATKNVFQKNFNSALELFQAFQVLLTLNLYRVSDKLKSELYQSDSHYVSETVPTLASDERIMRFKFVEFKKSNIDEPVMLKNLSDGEHQLLHTLGLCILFKDTNSLFLLDEPETHFNPQWRANFISRLRQSFSGSQNQEMLITTHTPFLISDSEPEKVLVFEKNEQNVSVSNPEYNTLGASINQITMATFDKRETIGGLAQSLLNDFKVKSEKQDVDKKQLVKDINNKLGDSVEKVLLIKTILDSMEGSQ